MNWLFWMSPLESRIGTSEFGPSKSVTSTSPTIRWVVSGPLWSMGQNVTI